MEKQLTANDLIDGQYYNCDYNNINYTFIKRNYSYATQIVHASTSKKRLFSKQGWDFYRDSINLRLATPSEIKHLDACIAADKYVELIKEVEYEIY